jgi:hypothetical protein
MFRWLANRRRAGAQAGLKFDSRKLRGQIRAVTADAVTASHLAAAIIAASLSLLVTVVAATFLILGPRWLGVVTAAVALVAWGVSGFEIRRFVRGAQMRRWRHRHVVIDGNDEATQAH